MSDNPQCSLCEPGACHDDACPHALPRKEDERAVFRHIPMYPKVLGRKLYGYELSHNCWNIYQAENWGRGEVTLNRHDINGSVIIIIGNHTAVAKKLAELGDPV